MIRTEYLLHSMWPFWRCSTCGRWFVNWYGAAPSETCKACPEKVLGQLLDVQNTRIIHNNSSQTIPEGALVYCVYRPRIWWNPRTWFGCRWVMKSIVVATEGGWHIHEAPEEPE